MNKKLFVVALALFIVSTSSRQAFAQVDCSVLDPRAKVSNSLDLSIKASVDTLYKIAKAGGNVQINTKKEIENLQKGSPITEQGTIKLRTLYLFCGIVANAQDISTEKKVHLYKVMMNMSGERDSENKTTKDNRASIPPRINVNGSGNIVTQGQIGNNSVINQGKPARTILKDERDNAISILRSVASPTKVTLMCIMNDAEAYKYAEQWQTVLHQAGWPVTDITSAMWVKPPEGIFLGSKDGNSPAAKAILEVIGSVDKNMTAVLESTLADGEVSIIIGSNPQ